MEHVSKLWGLVSVSVYPMSHIIKTLWITSQLILPKKGFKKKKEERELISIIMFGLYIM